ncbi:hypothetical protein GQ600_13245 [Phytophthora cactorum]|nr:hypothetical protein GQ600_13245 [Phytophthora cactorum]
MYWLYTVSHTQSPSSSTQHKWEMFAISWMNRLPRLLSVCKPYVSEMYSSHRQVVELRLDLLDRVHLRVATKDRGLPWSKNLICRRGEEVSLLQLQEVVVHGEEEIGSGEAAELRPAVGVKERVLILDVWILDRVQSDGFLHLAVVVLGSVDAEIESSLRQIRIQERAIGNRLLHVVTGSNKLTVLKTSQTDKAFYLVVVHFLNHGTSNKPTQRMTDEDIAVVKDRVVYHHLVHRLQSLRNLKQKRFNRANAIAEG